jgi:hypothetical protein
MKAITNTSVHRVLPDLEPREGPLERAQRPGTDTKKANHRRVVYDLEKSELALRSFVAADGHCIYVVVAPFVDSGDNGKEAIVSGIATSIATLATDGASPAAPSTRNSRDRN